MEKLADCLGQLLLAAAGRNGSSQHAGEVVHRLGQRLQPAEKPVVPGGRLEPFRARLLAAPAAASV